MDFIKAYTQIARRACKLGKKARREGLLALEDDVDEIKRNERDVFEYGLNFAVDGSDASFIDKILTNLVKQEKNEEILLLKTIQKEAVLAIQEGLTTRQIIIILNSYTNLSLLEDEVYREMFYD